MEVFVEEDVVAPVGIGLELLRAAVDGSPAVLVTQADAVAPAVRLHQVGVRKGRLRILVEILHVRVGRRAVEVEVVLLNILAMIALAVGQSEEPLLENCILAVPQGQREAEVLPVVGDAPQTVLAPAVGARAGMIVGEEISGVAIFAVVLAHSAPLSFAQVGPPFFPRNALFLRCLQPRLFLAHWTPPNRIMDSVVHDLLTVVCGVILSIVSRR